MDKVKNINYKESSIEVSFFKIYVMCTDDIVDTLSKKNLVDCPLIPPTSINSLSEGHVGVVAICNNAIENYKHVSIGYTTCSHAI